MTSVRRTPPMGWNSWDCYGTTVNEAEVLANAEFMAEHLLAYGWDTVVIDIDWSDPTARSHGYNDGAPLVMDEYGRLVPDPERFPSSVGGAGFAPIARRIHELGLRFGIHTMRGIPRRAVELDTPVLGSDARASQIADTSNACEWNPDMYGLDHTHHGAQDYYDSTLALYAEWGVDFIKADDMLWPYQQKDIEAYARAIRRTGRAVELSLSPGRDLSLARLEHLREHATMWRICDDLWDNWQDLEANFSRFARWAPHASPLGWPDGDMLPLGRIGIRAERGQARDDALTPAERVTLMTLWLIARSPLMIGGDLPSSHPDTVALFTNADALALLHSTGSREVFREDGLIVWTADGPNNERYVAAFNLTDAERSIAIDSQNVGLPAIPQGDVLELWTQKKALTRRSEPPHVIRGVAHGSTAILADLAPHGCALYRYS